MKFFIDTANLEQITEAQNLGILDGVTTNPSLMAMWMKKERPVRHTGMPMWMAMALAMRAR